MQLVTPDDGFFYCEEKIFRFAEDLEPQVLKGYKLGENKLVNFFKFRLEQVGTKSSFHCFLFMSMMKMDIIYQFGELMSKYLKK